MSTNLFFYHFTIQNTILEDVIRDLKIIDNREVLFEDNCDAPKIVEKLRDWTFGIVCLSILDNDSLKRSLLFLRKMYEAINNEEIKVICFNDILNPNVSDALYRAGAVDVFDGKITAKAFRHKVDFLTKFLESKWAQVVVKKKAQKIKDLNNERIRLSKGIVEDVEPLMIERDFWIIDTKEDATYAMKKWAIFLKGPGPQTVKWEKKESKIDMKGADELWKLTPFKEENKDLRFFNARDEKEGWMFIGLKPKFDINKIKWLFTGDSPNLFFQGKDVICDKFMAKDANIYVAKNSVRTLAFEEMIMSTIGQNLLADQEVIGKTTTVNEKNVPKKKNSDKKTFSNAVVEKEDQVIEEIIPIKKELKAKDVMENVEVFQFGKKNSSGVHLDIEKEDLSEEEKNKRENINKVLDEFMEETILSTSELKTYLYLGGDPKKGTECLISDIFEDQMTLTTKVKNKFKVDDVVNLFLIFKFEGEINDLTYKGDITEIDIQQEDGQGDAEYFINLKIYNFDQDVYDNFLADYGKVQNQIVNYMRKLKGAA